MRLFGIEITTSHALALQVGVAAKAYGEEHAAEIVRRYAHNQDILASAIAAHLGVADKRYLADAPSFREPMTRAINAFADGLEKVRAEPVAGSRSQESRDWDHPRPPEAGRAAR